MLATTATLSGDTSPFTRIPVTFLRPDGSSSASNAFVGQLTWSVMSGDAAALGVPAAFKSFCIEGLQSVSPGINTYGNARSLATSGLLGSTRAGLLEGFWRQYGPSGSTGFADNTSSAAFQLAVWEIINDGIPARNEAASALGAGRFSVGKTHLTTPAVVRATAWLNGFDEQAPGISSVALYALENPTRQDQAVAVPVVDLDVDSDNSASLVRSLFEERIEEDPARPGVIVPVGGGRAQMIVDVPVGRTASLSITQGADKVEVYANDGRRVLWSTTTSLSLPAQTGTTRTPVSFWIQAVVPSAGLADIAFTLTTTGTGPASSDIVRATAVAVDLDVDSNNDGSVDPDNGPAGTDDRIEQDASQGLVLPVYAGDSDGDGVIDTQDFNGIAGRSFVPLTLSINGGAANAWRWPIRMGDAPNEDLPGLAFTFTFSDAGLGPNAAGRYRIWTKDARFARTPQDLVTSGTPIMAWDLLRASPPAAGPDPLLTHGTFTLYLEAVGPSDVVDPITVSMGGAGAWANAVTRDVVHVRGLQPAVDLDVDSNNDEDFGVPATRSPWEEKLESHPYALGKLVMQSSTAFGSSESVAEDQLATSFTPVVVELPKNLPADARTIGVTFAMDAIGALDSGEIRLWIRNKGPGLRPEDAAGRPSPLAPWNVFGDRVYFGKPYTLSQLNYNPTTGQAVLYMDGHVATRNVTLNEVEQGLRDRGILQATLTFAAPNARIALADDSVQYLVVRDDFFYRDFQRRPEVRSAIASRAVYSFADLPNMTLKRLTPGELRAILEIDPNSEAAAMLYNDADTPEAPTAYPGFKAVLYQDYAAVADNTFVLAFGGTDDKLGVVFNGDAPEVSDWVENIGQGFGFRIGQYRYAMDVVRAVESATTQVTGGATLVTTGHSLGGGLASAASVVTGATGITFNAAGLHENTLRMYFEKNPAELAVALDRYHKPHGLLNAYTVDWDILSNFQDRYSDFVNPALGDRKKLDGPYDFAATVLEAIDVAFDTAVLVPVVGTLVKLGIDLAAKAGTGYLMYRSHSMDTVLYGLLVEEHLVTAHRDLLGYPTSRFL